MKTNTKNLHEPVDSKNYKKKYLLRVIEHEEAEKEIQIAKRKQSTDVYAEVPEMQRMDETPPYKY